MPVRELNENSNIIVVGCGAFGLSTALHLARRGFKNVLAFGTHPVPSPVSASNDINKIIDYKGSPGEYTHPLTRSSAGADREARP